MADAYYIESRFGVCFGIIQLLQSRDEMNGYHGCISICIYYIGYIHLYIPIIRHFRNSCWPPKYSCMSCIVGSKVKGCDQRFVFQGGEGS